MEENPYNLNLKVHSSDKLLFDLNSNNFPGLPKTPSNTSYISLNMCHNVLSCTVNNDKTTGRHSIYIHILLSRSPIKLLFV